MERNNSVGVISYKELEIAMERKSVVKAWNTEHSKQKKKNYLHCNTQMTSIFLWRVFQQKKKKVLKIYGFCFLIVFPADFPPQNCWLLKGDPFTPACNCLTLNCTVMCRWYMAPSKLHNSWSHCFREEARNVNTVTEKACVGGKGGGHIVWRWGDL